MKVKYFVLILVLLYDNIEAQKLLYCNTGNTFSVYFYKVLKLSYDFHFFFKERYVQSIR